MAVPASPTRADRMFLRASQSAQVLGLVLAVFGYFYTVQPVYRKALLDEDNARLTLELNAKKTELAKKDDEIGNRQRELALLGVKIKAAESSLAENQKKLSAVSASKAEQYQQLRMHLALQYKYSVQQKCAIHIDQFDANKAANCLAERLGDSSFVKELSLPDQRKLRALVDAASPQLRDELQRRYDSYRRDQDAKAALAAEAQRVAQKAREAAKANPRDYQLDFKAGQAEREAWSIRSKAEIEHLFAHEKLQPAIFEATDQVWSAFVADRPLGQIAFQPPKESKTNP